VIFTEENGGLSVEATVANVPPGKHGFHVHENGSCAEMGKAAGDILTQTICSTGFTQRWLYACTGRDMGNIEIGPDGTGTFKLFMPGLTLKEGNMRW